MNCDSSARTIRASRASKLAPYNACVACVACVMVACAPAPALKDPPAPAVALPECTPNLDGRITRDELPFIVGATAHVRVGTDVAIDTRGEPARGSARSWDFTRPDASDQPQGDLTLEEMSGHWFTDEFPDADLAGPLAPENRLFGPLSIDDDGVLLWGSASREENPDEGKTLLVYNEPARLYPFPIEVGAHAESESTALGGVAFGIPVAFQDTTTVDVTAHGEVLLPELIVQDAMRVTVRLERVPVAGIAVQQVTHVWLNECLGEVARATSPVVPLTDELDDEFTTAHEMWRLAF